MTGISYSNSKAIMGAVFLEYLVYAFIYIVEGFRFKSLYGGEMDDSPAKDNKQKQSARPRQEEQKEGGEDEDVSPNDI